MAEITLDKDMLEMAAFFPNGPHEAELEEIVFQAANGAYEKDVLQGILASLWYAFVRREGAMEKYEV